MCLITTKGKISVQTEKQRLEDEMKNFSGGVFFFFLSLIDDSKKTRPLTIESNGQETGRTICCSDSMSV